MTTRVGIDWLFFGSRLRMGTPLETLGRSELELLQWINEHHPVSVAEAVAGFGMERDLARTTVQTMMQRMLSKGFLKRKKGADGFQYSPTVKLSKVIASMIQEFVHGVLGGSVSPFVAYLNDAHQLSETEVQQLRALVDQLDSTAPPRQSDSKIVKGIENLVESKKQK